MPRGEGRATRKAGTFGSVDQRASGRFRASYIGPDELRHRAPTMFETARDARAWLALQQSQIITEKWRPPAEVPARTVPFGEYADGWLRDRTLQPRTRAHYRTLLDRHLIPTFGESALAAVAAEDVRRWHHESNWQRGARSTNPTKSDITATLRAHCYGLLKSIYASAVSDGLVATSPCTIRGGGSAPTARKVQTMTVKELSTLVNAMPEHLRVLILLSAWCALRFGEATELRRDDVVLDPDRRRGVLHVRRGVVRVDGGTVVGRPKTDSSVRDVSIPPHVVPAVAEHLLRYVGVERDALLFPAKHGGHLAPSTLYRHFYKARDTAGRPDLAVHHLRHVGASLAAASGASLRELMDRLGHATPAASLRYQHAAAGRDDEIAEALSRLAGE
jgi:integrase